MLALYHQHEAIKRMVASKKTDNPYEEKNFAVRSRTAIPHWLSATCSLSLTAMVKTQTTETGFLIRLRCSWLFVLCGNLF